MKRAENDKNTYIYIPSETQHVACMGRNAWHQDSDQSLRLAILLCSWAVAYWKFSYLVSHIAFGVWNGKLWSRMIHKGQLQRIHKQTKNSRLKKIQPIHSHASKSHRGGRRGHGFVTIHGGSLNQVAFSDTLCILYVSHIHNYTRN